MQDTPSDIVTEIFKRTRNTQRTIEWAEQCLTFAQVSQQWRSCVKSLVQESFIKISRDKKAELLCYAIMNRSQIPVISFLIRHDIDIHILVTAPYASRGSSSWGYGKSNRFLGGEWNIIRNPCETSVWHEAIKWGNIDIVQLLIKYCQSIDIPISTREGMTSASMIAEQRNNTSLVQLLSDHISKSNVWY